MKFYLNKIEDLTEPGGGTFKTESASDAYAFCKKAALGHYENFPVGSILIPKNLRKHFFAVYAFSRIADDIADELVYLPPKRRISLLKKFEATLLQDDKIAGNPIFEALNRTRREMELPVEPFRKLLKAFRMDCRFKRPKQFRDLTEYCRYSANPVGELVLRLFGLFDARTAPLSDAICTGLQLANFWQDFSRDIPLGRNYIPSDLTKKYDVELENIIKENLQDRKKTANFNKLSAKVYDKTEEFFAIGEQLIKLIPNYRLRVEIEATLRGGKKILGKTKNMKEMILVGRPEIKKSEFVGIFVKSIIGNFL